MTIGKSGSAIVDQLARAKSRNDAAERAAKAKAKKSAKSGRGGRGGKTGGARAKAGRSAIKRGASKGRGIVAKTAHRKNDGKSFRRLVNYAMNKEGAILISSNCGITAPDMIRDMKLAAGTRPDITKPVGHISLSVPPSTKLTNKNWLAIEEFVRASLQLDDKYPFCVVRHRDSEHDHVHIAYSRVSMDGRVHDQAFLGLRLAALEDEVEEKFSLPLLPVDRSKLVFNKNEIEKSIRLREPPERKRLSDVVQSAVKGNPSVVMFVRRCADAGIVVRPNLATSTKKLNGFSFSYVDSEVEYKGSQIGAAWAALQTAGVTYVEDRDYESLAALKHQLESGKRTHDSARPVSVENGKVGEVGARENQATSQTNQVASTATDGSAHSVDPFAGVARVQAKPIAAATYEKEPAPLDESAFKALKKYLLEFPSEGAFVKALALEMNYMQQREINELIKTIRYNLKRLGEAERTSPAESTSPRDADLDVPRF